MRFVLFYFIVILPLGSSLTIFACQRTFYWRQSIVFTINGSNIRFQMNDDSLIHTHTHVRPMHIFRKETKKNIRILKAMNALTLCKRSFCHSVHSLRAFVFFYDNLIILWNQDKFSIKEYTSFLWTMHISNGTLNIQENNRDENVIQAKSIWNGK